MRTSTLHKYHGSGSGSGLSPMAPISHTNPFNTLKSIKLSLLPSHHIQPTFYNRSILFFSNYISIIMVVVFLRQYPQCAGCQITLHSHIVPRLQEKPVQCPCAIVDQVHLALSRTEGIQPGAHPVWLRSAVPFGSHCLWPSQSQGVLPSEDNHRSWRHKCWRHGHE